MRVGLIADDLTGACDAASAFLGSGRVAVGIWPYIPPSTGVACLAVSTETRLLGERNCELRSREAAARLRREGCDRLYCKVDSMLRGKPGAQLAGVLSDWAGPCLFAPALPAMGRTTRGGVQRWPGGEQAIAPLLTSAGRPVRQGGVDDLVPGCITIADAETEAELAELAIAVAKRTDVLPVGTAGLAGHLPAALGMAGEPGHRRWRQSASPVAVVGSRAAAHQADVAERRGWRVARLAPDDRPPALNGHDGLLLTGGETAVRVLRSLGASGLELVGLAAPLMPIATVVGGPRHGLPVVLKAGAFGGPDAIERGLAKLRWGGP